eukprot:scaffold289_cov67-Isochrysis_galbana.AAC.1
MNRTALWLCSRFGQLRADCWWCTCGSERSSDAARDRTSATMDETAASRTAGGAPMRTACSPISAHSSWGSSVPTAMSAAWKRLGAPPDQESAVGGPARAGCGWECDRDGGGGGGGGGASE